MRYDAGDAGVSAPAAITASKHPRAFQDRMLEEESDMSSTQSLQRARTCAAAIFAGRSAPLRIRDGAPTGRVRARHGTIVSSLGSRGGRPQEFPYANQAGGKVSGHRPLISIDWAALPTSELWGASPSGTEDRFSLQGPRAELQFPPRLI